MQKQFNKSSVKIKEIFTSIQGEGIEAGLLHTFVRFTKCNLNCKYCDTDFQNDAKEYTQDGLFDILKNENAATISLTGGEPLLDSDFLYSFLKKYRKKLNKKIYLETNGTLSDELKRLIKYIDIVAMDIKIESATGQINLFEKNLQFLKIAKKKAFIKVVFDKNIEDFEIQEIIKIAKRYNVEIILQPKMPMDTDIDLMDIYNKFYICYKKVRLIPQTHKFLCLL